MTRATVGKWRSRFVERRLDGLHDEPRPGGLRSISDDEVERVIVKTLEETPRDATHWSTRSMARATGMSQSAISRIWQAFGLKPHLAEEFKLSPDPPRAAGRRTDVRPVWDCTVDAPTNSRAPLVLSVASLACACEPAKPAEPNLSERSQRYQSLAVLAAPALGDALIVNAAEQLVTLEVAELVTT